MKCLFLYFLSLLFSFLALRLVALLPSLPILVAKAHAALLAFFVVRVHRQNVAGGSHGAARLVDQAGNEVIRQKGHVQNLLVLDGLRGLDQELPVQGVAAWRGGKRVARFAVGVIRAVELVEDMQALSPDDIRALMGVSEKIADLNHRRFMNWSRPFGLDNANMDENGYVTLEL